MNHCRPNPLSWQMCLLWKFRSTLRTVYAVHIPATEEYIVLPNRGYFGYFKRLKSTPPKPWWISIFLQNIETHGWNQSNKAIKKKFFNFHPFLKLFPELNLLLQMVIFP